MILSGETEVLEETHFPVSLCPPQISPCFVRFSIAGRIENTHVYFKMSCTSFLVGRVVNWCVRIAVGFKSRDWSLIFSFRCLPAAGVVQRCVFFTYLWFRSILASPPLWLQKHTDLRAHYFAHPPDLWNQPRLADVTCSRSWRLYGIDPATLCFMGRDISVGITTRYGLDGPVI
jgi:hypothetical protein